MRLPGRSVIMEGDTRAVCMPAEGGRMPADRLFTLLQLSRRGFDQRLHLVGGTDWSRPTPCSEWSVRDIVNHVVGQNFRHVRLLRGGSFEEYLAVREDDWLGDDPLASWDRGNEEYDIAYAQPGALDKVVEYHRGPTTGGELLRWRVFDMTVHTWDLARAIGADDRLDEDLVIAVLESISGPLGSPGSSYFVASSGALPADASPQERLLFFCGRTAPGQGATF